MGRREHFSLEGTAAFVQRAGGTEWSRSFVVVPGTVTAFSIFQVDEHHGIALYSDCTDSFFSRSTGDPAPAGKWLSWGLFIGLPIVLTRYWFQHNTDVEVFPWVKLYTIAFSISWLTALRFTSLGERPRARFCILLLLVVNIVEALIQDAVGRNLPHYLVLLSGILLIVTLPRPLTSVEVDIAGPLRDLHYRGMTRTWIVEYTAWNGAFVFLNFPFVAGYQCAVLGAALIVGLFAPHLWLQARGYTLGVSLLMLATFRDPLLRWSDTSHWAHPDRQDLAAAVCPGIAIGYTYRYFFRSSRFG